RLWKAAAGLPEDDPLRAALHRRLLLTGLAPEDLFEATRERGEVVEGLNYYRCAVRQPLDAAWAESHGPLSGQEKWTRYDIYWGVLAADEDDAARRVLQWQAQCYPLGAAVEEAELLSDGFRDKPGVVWQGARWGADTDEDEGGAAEGGEGT